MNTNQERFLHNIQIDSETECWSWKGRKNNGAGLFEFDGKQTVLSRAAYEIFIGSPPPRKNWIPRKCQNRWCLNPKHFIIWTDIVKRLQDSTVKSGECLLWTGNKNKAGYGKIYIEGRQLSAHRVAFEAYKNVKLSINELVCHTCDTPSCIAEAHLFVGDYKANRQDCIEKNRQAQGETNGRAKLRATDIDLIRNSKLPGCTLACQLNITQSTISKIRNNKIWKSSTFKPTPKTPRVVVEKQQKVYDTRGETNGRAKLKWIDIDLIRASNLSNRILADQFSVSPNLIWSIRKNRLWKRTIAASGS